jgi:hypothetical protein
MPALIPFPVPSPAAPSSGSSTQALDAIKDELLALDPRTLLALNVDIASAAMVVIGVAPVFRKHRDALVALCGEDMAKSVDRLELLARAALQAHAKHRAVASGVDVQPLSEQLVGVRDVLLAEVRSLIVRRVLHAQIIRELTLSTGYKHQCVDVLQLVSAMQDNWDVVEAETRISRAYIEGAEALAHALITAVGQRDQAARSPTADLRQRAYTLLARTYDRVRRMVSFLRWDERDADRIAPAFHNHRGSRRRKDAETDTSALAPAPGIGADPHAPGIGLPGGSPFTEA